MKKVISRSILSLLMLITAVTILGACTVTVQFTISYYDYDNTGERWALHTTQVFTRGTNITPMAAPTKSGYTFDGWYFEDTFTNKFTGTTVNDNFSVYAKWTPIVVKYTVSFTDWDDSVIQCNGENSQQVVAGQNAVPPANPSRNGYTFTGWDTEYTNVTSNLTIKAQYSVSKYTIEFSSDGLIVDTKEVNYLSNINGLISIEKIGYELAGWYFDELFEDKAETMPYEDVTVYAKWNYVGIDGLAISSNRNNNVITYGQSIELTVLHADLDLTYQWYCGNVLLVGETANKLTVIPNASDTEYSVVVKAEDGYEERTSATLYIYKAALTVTADAKEVTYGDAVDFTATMTGFVNGDTSSLFVGSLIFDCDLNAGTHDITVSGITSENYNVTYVKGTLTVNRAQLSITADNKAIFYGDNSPSYAYAPTGFANGETIADLTGTLEYSCTYTSGDNAGAYAIVPSGLSSENYDITYHNGTLTVGKIKLTVTADDVSIIYGQTPVYTAKFKGFIGGDDESSVGTLVFTCENSNVGEHLIQLSGLASDNYNFNYEPGTLTISPAPLSVTVNDVNVVYGQSYSFSAQVTGLVNGDTESALGLTYSNKEVNAGAYTISAQSSNSNYDISFTSGTLTITAYLLEITIDEEMGFDGIAWSKSDWTLNLVTGDILTGTLSTKDSAIGEYEGMKDFVWSNLEIKNANGDDVSGNYTLVYDLYVLIEVGVITSNAQGYAGTYDGVSHGITVNVSIAAAYEIEYCATENGTYTSTQIKYTNVGVYTVYYRISATDYTTKTGSATVNISKARLTVTAGDATVVYGNAAGSNTYSIGGFVNGETESVLLGSVQYSCAYVIGSNAGETYPITPSGLTSGNYEITYENGTLTVVKDVHSGISHGGFTLVYSGKTLAESGLALNQNFRWANGDEVPTVGKTLYGAVYNTDPTNFEDFALDITITVSKGTLTLTTMKVFDMAYGGSVTISTDACFEGQPVAVDLSYSTPTFNVGGTYLVTVTITSENWELDSNTLIVKIRSVKIGTVMYTIEDAIHTASSGTIIVVANTQFATDATVKATYYNADSYYTIKSGVTVLVPFNSTYTATFATGVTGTNPTAASAYVTLSLSGVSLNVLGILSVNGSLGSATGGNGHMCNTVAYGMLDMDVNSVVTIKSGGALHSRGFVTGAGSVIAESGAKVYDVFQILDYRGGTSSNNNYKTVFPFDQHTIQNIETRLVLNNGANFYAYYYVFASIGSTNGSMTIVGPEASNMLQLTSGYIVKTLNRNSGISKYECFGNVEFNYISLKLQAGLIAITIDSNGKETPIPYTYNFVVKPGFTFTMKSSLKVLPGTILHVESGATLIVNSGLNLFVYNSNQFSAIGDGYGFFRYPANRAQRGINPVGDVSSADKGKLIIDGKLVVFGNIAGPVETTKNIEVYGNTTISIKEVEIYNTGDPSYIIDVSGTLQGFNHAVTLDSNTGSALAISRIYAFGAENKTVDLAQYNPTKTGYTFAGWYTSMEYTEKLEGEQTFEAGITLYAKWTIDVTFHYGDEEVVRTQVFGKNYVLPDVDEAGQTVEAWWTSLSYVSTISAADIVGTVYTDLYATFVETEITVTLNTMGGDSISDIVIYGFGKINPNVTDIPTYLNHDFDGWFYDEECTQAYNANAFIVGSFTLYAKWSLQTLITYVDNGGTEHSFYVARGEEFTMPSYAEEGYITVWFTNEDWVGYYVVGGTNSYTTVSATYTHYKSYYLLSGTGDLTKAIVDGISAENQASLFITGFTTIANNAFTNNLNIKFVILDTITTITAGSATASSTNISSTKVGPTNAAGAFSGASNLQNVVLGKSIATIGAYSFWNCEALTSVTILSANAPTMASHQYSTSSSSRTWALAFGGASGFSSTNTTPQYIRLNYQDHGYGNAHTFYVPQGNLSKYQGSTNTWNFYSSNGQFIEF